jgi:hypothetical protein
LPSKVAFTAGSAPLKRLLMTCFIG